MTSDPAGDTTRVRFAVLGPLEVRVDDHALALGGVKPRTLLALLLTDANRVVSTTRIIEALWGDDANERSPSTLQVHVSNLRHALAPTAEALGVDEIVRTQRPGYVVTVDAATVDLARFRDLVASGQQQAGRGDAVGASQTFGAALALVRGDPLADLSDEPFAAPVSAYLRQLVAHGEPPDSRPSSRPGTTARSSVRSKRRLQRSRSTSTCGAADARALPLRSSGRRAGRLSNRTSSAHRRARRRSVRRAARPRESHSCTGRNARGADRDGQRRRAADGAAFECAHPFGRARVPVARSAHQSRSAGR